jgi:hypothetical protein
MVDAQTQAHMAGGTGDGQCTSTKVQGMCRKTPGLHKHHPQCKGEQKRGSVVKTARARALSQDTRRCEGMHRKMWGLHELHCGAKGQPQRVAVGGWARWRTGEGWDVHEPWHENIIWGGGGGRAKQVHLQIRGLLGRALGRGMRELAWRR